MREPTHGSRLSLIAVAAFCSLLPIRGTAQQPRTATVPTKSAPAASEAQLLAALLATVSVAESDIMETYLTNPRPEVIREFIDLTRTTLQRMQAAGWRPGWGPDYGCPGGTTHCWGCGCAIPSGRAMPSGQGPGCIPLPSPWPPARNLNEAQLMALLHTTFGKLQAQMLLWFVHGPRLAVVRDLVHDLRRNVDETRQRVAKLK